MMFTIYFHRMFSDNFFFQFTLTIFKLPLRIVKMEIKYNMNIGILDNNYLVIILQ